MSIATVIGPKWPQLEHATMSMSLLNLDVNRFRDFAIFAVADPAAFETWASGEGLSPFRGEGKGSDDQTPEPVFLLPYDDMRSVALAHWLDTQAYIVQLTGQAPTVAGRRWAIKIGPFIGVEKLGCWTEVNEEEARANGAWSRFDLGDGGGDRWYIAKPAVDDACAACRWGAGPVSEEVAEGFAPFEGQDVFTPEGVARTVEAANASGSRFGDTTAIPDPRQPGDDPRLIELMGRVAELQEICTVLHETMTRTFPGAMRRTLEARTGHHSGHRPLSVG